MIKQVLQQAALQLQKSSLSPQLDAEVLLAFVLKKDRSWVITHLDENMSDDQTALYHHLLKRRSQGEPVAYLTGIKAFYGSDFLVSPAVLIPRPESEQLIDLIKAADAHPKVIIDIGTGSGCLAITLAKLYPKAAVTGIDVSQDALAIAEKNKERIQTANVHFTRSDLLQNYSGPKADLLIANLPYLTQTDIAASPTAAELAFEPQSALVSEDDGLKLIKDFLLQAVETLKPEGTVYLELEPRQVPDLTAWIERKKIPFRHFVHADLKGDKRFLVLRFKNLETRMDS